MSRLNIAICIPARIASTRFPDKPLALLNGEPMISRVYNRCRKTGLDTFVLTDSKRIASLFPHGDFIIQDAPYENGTERCAATVYTKMNKDLQKDPNSVKLIHTHDSAHWFCRAGLEYGAHHLGVYGYTCKALATYPSLHQFEEERIEKLEQLRWLQNNYTMSVFETEFTGMEINTPEDLIEWHRLNSQ
jgi:CMP-2-keto-3-deoxyoctulosonic acid synthetase